jgi:hypothetical protein
MADKVETDLLSPAWTTCSAMQKLREVSAAFFAQFEYFLALQKAWLLDASFCILGSGVFMLLDLASSAHLSEHDDARVLEEGVTLTLDACLTTRQAWSAERRRYHPWGSRAKRGHADGTLQALRVCRSFTLICVRCGSLVHWMSARSRAFKAEREAFAPGDGCSSRCCSLNHRPAQYLSGQMAMAAALEACTRALIAWPSGCGAREIQVLPQAATLAAVHGVREQLERGIAEQAVRRQPARSVRVRDAGLAAADTPSPALAAASPPSLTLAARSPPSLTLTADAPSLVLAVDVPPLSLALATDDTPSPALADATSPTLDTVTTA